MEKVTTVAWKCRYCGKRIIVAATCARHEQLCDRNPANHHPCLNCAHLERTSVFVDDGRIDGSGEWEAEASSFLCKFSGRYLYTHKALARKHYCAIGKAVRGESICVKFLEGEWNAD